MGTGRGKSLTTWSDVFIVAMEFFTAHRMVGTAYQFPVSIRSTKAVCHGWYPPSNIPHPRNYDMGQYRVTRRSMLRFDRSGA